jgi:hypothetical protein
MGIDKISSVNRPGPFGVLGNIPESEKRSPLVNEINSSQSVKNERNPGQEEADSVEAYKKSLKNRKKKLDGEIYGSDGKNDDREKEDDKGNNLDIEV